MTKTMTNDLTSLDEQIVQAERDLEAAQNHWRNRPRGAPRFGGDAAPIRIAPIALADKLDRALAVDRAIIRLEQLKKQRAEVRLAELINPETLAAEQAAEQEARRDLDEVEAKVAAARTVWLQARGAMKDRQERVKTMQAEIARAENAIRAAEAVREKEQTQRGSLIVA